MATRLHSNPPLWVTMLAIVLHAVAFNFAARAQTSPASPVTYNGQIASIFYKNCTTCHHDGGSGPFSLMNYGDARRWGPTVEIVTQSRYMPPWLPSGPHNQFADDRRLPAKDIALIRRWVSEGMKEGEKRDVVASPVYASDWQLGPPDLVLEMDTPVAVPAVGTDLYRNVILPVQIPGTRWVRAMEIKPGSPRVVHHANLLIDRTASLRRAHPEDWKGGIPGMDLMVDAGDSFDPDSHFLYWKPDSSALVEPADLPWRLDPGNDLVLNLHLKPTGKPETARVRIGLYFTPGPAKRFPILVQLEDDAALKIPPDDASFVVEDQLKLPEDVDVLAVYPHAHYLGKRLEGWAELPNHERRELILIENWDIDRQSIYRYTNPVFLPANSVLHMRYTYDNSAANPHNPNSPPIRVTAGNRSADEMGHLWIQMLPRANGGDGDLRAPILRAWMEHRIEKDPQDPIANFNVASLDMTEGSYRQAIDHYREALKARPNDPRTMTALASALSKSGDQQASLSLLREALTVDPEYADARYDLAVNELQQGDYAAAERELRTVLARQPQDAIAHLNLGGVLLTTGKSDAAQAEFETVLKIDANNFEALYNLSMIELDAGQVDKALGHLRSAELLHPADAEVHRALAEVYDRSGDRPNALREQKLIGTPAK